MPYIYALSHTYVHTYTYTMHTEDDLTAIVSELSRLCSRLAQKYPTNALNWGHTSDLKPFMAKWLIHPDWASPHATHHGADEIPPPTKEELDRRDKLILHVQSDETDPVNTVLTNLVKFTRSRYCKCMCTCAYN